MAPKNVKVTIKNSSGLRLVIKDYNILNGAWSKNRIPPDEIAPGESASFVSEFDEDKYGRGAEGFVKYYIGDRTKGAPLVLNWENPNNGNSFFCFIPSGYKFTQSAETEKNAELTFILKKRKY